MNCDASAAGLDLCIVARSDLHARSERGEAQEVALVLRQVLDLRRRDVGRRRSACGLRERGGP